MKNPLFYTAGDTPALQHARNQLQHWGYAPAAAPSEHITHLLLPVPSMEAPGILKGGTSLEAVLKSLPPEVTVMGGMLPPLPNPTIDFLADEHYLIENAAITADCTMQLLQKHHVGSLQDTSVLIIGFGRIGKCLAPLLLHSGAAVTVAVRKESYLPEIEKAHCRGILTDDWQPRQYAVIINTAPMPVLTQEDAAPDALLIDLASVKGISGDRVLWARGLPNKHASEASGALIAKTALRCVTRKE